MRLIGLDFGSVYFKGVVINPGTRIYHSWYCKNTGNTIDLLDSFLTKISELFPDEKFKAGITESLWSNLDCLLLIGPDGLLRPPEVDYEG